MDYRDWVKQATEYLKGQWGLDATFAGQVALFWAYCALYGLNPTITSGYRDPAKQKAMQEAWDRGQRSGLKVRPASSSDHTRRRAVDITTSDPGLAARIARALGLGAGADFKTPDNVHFFRKG